MSLKFNPFVSYTKSLISWRRKTEIPDAWVNIFFKSPQNSPSSIYFLFLFNIYACQKRWHFMRCFLWSFVLVQTRFRHLENYQIYCTAENNKSHIIVVDFACYCGTQLIRGTALHAGKGRGTQYYHQLPTPVPTSPSPPFGSPNDFYSKRTFNKTPYD